MGSVVMAAAVMGGLGLLCGAVLAMANRYLKVVEDPRIDDVEKLLPGSNCGACGEPGCRALAEKLVAGAKKPGSCTVSSPSGRDAIGEYLGVDSSAGEKRVARLHCAGGKSRAKQIAAYEGHATCRGASLTAAGGKGCSWGCLGLADCETACTFHAIRMTDDGLPAVDPALCTACGDCVTACPKALFEILPLAQPLLVQCKIPLAGDQARALCTVACDACGRCAQDAPAGLVTMKNNLPVIDASGLIVPTPAAILRCPTAAIQWVPGAQFIDSLPKGRRHARTS